MKVTVILLFAIIGIAFSAEIDFQRAFEKLEEIRSPDIAVFDIAAYVQTHLKYYIDKHTVVTDDGYTLELHRMYKTKDDLEGKPPVLLMHDFFGTSAVFVMLGPEKSLAYQLVDAGYDVWLGNNRGNTYARIHENYTLDDKEFWDFSFDEMGTFDVPKTIDYILTTTKSEQVSLVGLGVGGAQFLVTLSTLTDYNSKVNSLVALAPLAYVEHCTHPLAMVAKGHEDVLEGLAEKYNISEILSHYTTLESLLPGVCASTSQFEPLCELLLFLIYGFDIQQLDPTNVAQIFHILPGGMSVKEAIHYLQLYKSGGFRPFDNGIINNYDKYNMTHPPDYPLEKITAPVDIFYSQNDLWLNVIDAENLSEKIPNSELHLIDFKYFSHLDYIVGKDISSLVNFDLINALNVKNDLPLITTTVAPTTEPPTTNTGDDNTFSNTEPTVTEVIPQTTTDSGNIIGGSVAAFVVLVMAMLT